MFGVELPLSHATDVTMCAHNGHTANVSFSWRLILFNSLFFQ